MDSEVMWALCWSVVVNKELSRKAKLSMYQFLFVPNLSYRHEHWGGDRNNEITDTNSCNEFLT